VRSGYEETCNACALTGICCAGLTYATNLWLYIFEFAVFCFAMNLAMPYANAFAAEVDLSGRLVTAMPGSSPRWLS
jgi:hypothetical protein